MRVAGSQESSPCPADDRDADAAALESVLADALRWREVLANPEAILALSGSDSPARLTARVDDARAARAAQGEG